ncbi:ribonuclease [Saccharopolyspora sp. HNM0983]|uniref:Ribonuclease n=1 Tax=Saccharopolyspora montiporae TaxID=2781240 RepID=A0A929BAF6_9PSEU|nr:ribonuclease domain-containing protein [Saccharopolyspora sp. HNM0983]MBE9374411.1 ribonuclease [Saccharopolyspora sp. HNM0983]
MKWITTKAAGLLLAGLLAMAGLLGVQATAAALSPDRGAVGVVQQAPCGDTAEFEQVDLSALPPEAADTVGLIEQGGPYPYPQDDEVFQNREGILPDCDDGYYREYTVETPGSPDRGARRFVVGEGGEFFYTDDHYESFRITDTNA